jgi:hypothetical protein
MTLTILSISINYQNVIMPASFQNDFLPMSATGIPERMWSYLDSCAGSKSIYKLKEYVYLE